MNEKRKITKNSLTIIGGVCFILLALVTMLSNNTPFAFLSIAITAALGFVGFWVLMPFLIILGLYLIFKKKLLKFKLGLSIGGFFIMIVCFVILSSHWASIGVQFHDVVLDGYSKTSDGTSRYLIFSNSFDILGQIRASNSSPFNPQLGGGYVGFVLAGSINSAITPIGLNIVCWIFFFGGLSLLLNKEIKSLSIFLKKKAKQRKEKKAEEYEEVDLTPIEEEPITIAPIVEDTEPQPVTEPQPIVQEKVIQKPIYEDFHVNAINNDSSLKKARLVLREESVVEDSMVKKIEDANIAPEPVKSSFVEARFGVASKEENTEETPEVIPNVEPVPEAISEPEVAPVSFVEPSIPTPVVNPNLAQMQEPEPEVIPEPAPVPEVDYAHKPQPKANLVKNYIYPSLELLDLHEEADDATKNEGSCAERTEIINKTFESLRVGAQVVGHTVGPSVTRYDIQTNFDVSITVTSSRIGSSVAWGIGSSSSNSTYSV